MVKVTFNSSLAQKEPKKPEPVGTEQTLLPDKLDVEDGQLVRRQRPTPWCWCLWVSFIVVAITTVLGVYFFFAFGQALNWWSYRGENDNVHEFQEPDQETNSYEDYMENPDPPLDQGIYYEDPMENPFLFWECGVGLEDWDWMEEAEMSTEPPLPQLKERVQVLEDDNVELIQVPEFKFSGAVPAKIIHDFDKNLTAFLDLTLNKCYVVPLNTSAVLPPRDLQELITNVTAGTDLQHFHLVHEQLVVTGRLDDVEKLGPFISNMCRDYETYGLEHRPTAAGIQKREALNCRRIHHFENVYAMETQICEL